ncbi:MAG TPA: hypothetical protein VLU46_09370, partial [Thermoanaerobaculia bacterium]|nr:hypothetical protein [Thermoanaerobaculia bacterium]
MTLDRRDLGCIALLIAVATIFFSDVLFAGSNFFFRDLFIYHFPMKRIVRDAMLGGELPYWNWSYSNGQPLAANPAYELFYPVQWLILVGSYRFGFALHIIAHVYLALAGMYLLLREMTLGRAASTFGALSFGMGGLLLGSSTMLPTFFVWALAPMVAWSVLRAVREPSAARIAIAALFAGMQLIIGEPVSTPQMWLLILIGALMVNRRRAVPVIAIVIVIAIALAAVQIVPAIDHTRDSARARGLPFSNIREYALPVERPIELVVPHYYGVLTPFVIGFWGSSSFNRQAPYLYSIYNGIAIAILALAGLFLRARGALVTALLAIASYILAIGDRTPLLRALYDSGVARGVRYPEKFAAFGLAALTIFAATILDRVLSDDARARRAAVIAAAIVVAISAIPFAWSITPGFVQSFITYWHLHAEQAVYVPLARREWLIGLAIAGAAALLLAFLPRLPRRIWLLLGFTLVVIDLVPLANELAPRMPAEFFTPPNVVAALQSDRSAHALMNRADWRNYERNFKDIRG